MRTLAVATALTVALSTPAAAATTPSLPRPTGHAPVGVTTLSFVDKSRADPWVPSVPYRELMVSFFYPATSVHGPKKQYMTPLESERNLERQNIPGLPLDVLSTVRTNAVVDAKPAGRRHSLPLVVLSPGWTQPRATLTALAEDLASRGYAVAAIDHTYENRATTFPDGHVTGCAACEVDDQPGFWEKFAQVRSKDTSFVLDSLLSSKQGALIDPQRIGMTGHSAGGAITTQAMLADPRIRAGADIDGSIHVPLPASGLARPFLFLGSMDNYTPGAPGPYDDWETDWPHLTGWKRWLMVSGTVHASFTDLGVLAAQLGVDIGDAIDPYRALAVTRTYVSAFFDLHLRCRPQPLLAAPSPAFPEVTFIG
ncbi:Alpha/beta hydrolase family protein [Amycolatopsis tolypomycina]|uniref:Alpha/beta hydrolase family protein n=1 Tax=Amycolatopsis tolypomycina TaxID=208445 RepID=A0A1H5AQV9_9PSEU|nr:alpha/beta hydrolase [Amycolatopsis tolypomycina]SED44495.1 Alpha/beta hydrolase family protein [Amycolatopsis tolypomycina]